MKYYLNLFSPSTWLAFNENNASVSGFSKHQKTRANKIEKGDIFLCYLVKLSRWVGALEVVEGPYEDITPLFTKHNDKFIVRFKVAPIVNLEITNGIPIILDEVWKKIEWTKDKQVGSPSWGANFQSSLREIPINDAEYLLNLLKKQQSEKQIYELSKKDKKAISSILSIKTSSGEQQIEIPDKEEEQQTEENKSESIRQSLLIQKNLLDIGITMNYKIWIPKHDLTELEKFNLIDNKTRDKILDELPLSFDEAAIKTVEQIDVIWMDSRTIIRAFEIEGTTAIYSGLLRMADLLSIVPNLDIKFHIVALESMKEKVFKQISRPTFKLMQGDFSNKISFISYESIKELSENNQLKHLNHTVLDDYSEERDY